MKKPPHKAIHIAKSLEKPTHDQNLPKSMSFANAFFADPKNYFFSGTAVLRLNGF
jgi:hypothetical protein